MLNDQQKKFVLSEIKKDITYYKRSYGRAHFQVDISGLDVAQAADKLKELLGLEPPLENSEPRTLSIVRKGSLKPKLVYTNRRGKEYYLHVGKTKKGNQRYYFSMKNTGELATEVPEGYLPIFRFILVDQEQRLFTAERFCFKGRIDDWITLLSCGEESLQTLATRYVKHLGEDSFYELM